ncbi:MAG: site-2 protease family protein [Microgenomates group bacterium]|nr:site-2 protease family protein [Microgenomates group bacterium]
MINELFTSPLSFLVFFAALTVTIAIHEFFHAWVADRLGDPTARLAGRLTLNPLVHIDIVGLLFLFFVGFGWGKPVPFDPYNLKNPRKDAALISVAGPLSNFILAVLLSLLLRLFIFFNLSFLFTIGNLIFVPLITINLILGFFNLLPIHPLDGFKIVGGFLPDEKAEEWYSLERFGYIFLLMLILPLGNSSMLDLLIKPVFYFFLKLLLPFSLTGVI